MVAGGWASAQQWSCPPACATALAAPSRRMESAPRNVVASCFHALPVSSVVIQRAAVVRRRAPPPFLATACRTSLPLNGSVVQPATGEAP